jgi:hypothetical protein
LGHHGVAAFEAELDVEAYGDVEGAMAARRVGRTLSGALILDTVGELTRSRGVLGSF